MYSKEQFFFMEPIIRKATGADIDAVTEIYELIHTEEEAGRTTTGWKRGVYPTRAVAEAAVQRSDLFVMEAEGRVSAAAIINHAQVDIYAGAPWQYDAPDEQIMVLHTLVVDPRVKGRGLGRAFEAFYERYALEHGCPYLRIDTNARNTAAQQLYAHLNYREIAVIPCVFNGLTGVEAVLLEKRASAP